MADRSNSKFWLVVLMLPLLLLCSSVMAKIIYVDDDAAGANNGSSWIDAYNYLQDALADANTAEKPVEIRVAQGTYTPDRGMTQTLGDREATFRLINGVAICGGYAGHAESDPNDHDSDLYMSILSGDLEANDIEAERLFDIALDPNTRGRTENSKHVLIGSFTDETAVLDGFTITGGFGARRDYIVGGAGIDIESGSPTIANCVFIGNASFSSASALVNRNGSCPNLTNCTFSKNCSSDGTMENYQSSPILTYCRFSNSSYDVIRNRDNSNPILVDCTFEHNFDVINSRGDCNVSLTNCIFLNNLNRCIDHESGGRLSLTGCVFRDNFWCGIDSRADELTLTDCLFVHNISHGLDPVINHYGKNLILKNCEFRSNSGFQGALNVKGPDGTFIAENCIFSGNICEVHGGAIETSVKNSIISNCLFAGNVAGENGGAIRASSNGNMTIQNCTFSGNTAGDGGCSLFVWNKTKVTNCIFWGENSPVIQPQYNEPLISYSNVQGGWPGEGNIDVDPYFVSPGYWDLNGTPNDTADDVWMDGDYHLQSQAGHWDQQSQTWVQDSLTSLCIDAGDPNGPLGTEPFPNGGRINMGAYGTGDKASKSYIEGSS